MTIITHTRDACGEELLAVGASYRNVAGAPAIFLFRVVIQEKLVSPPKHGLLRFFLIIRKA